MNIPLFIHGHSQFQQYIWLWKKAPWDSINRALDLLPWCVLNDGNINDAVTLFTDLITAVVKDFVPRKRPRSHKFPPWFDPQIRFVLRNKMRAWLLWKQCPSDRTYRSFSNIRRYSKYLIGLKCTNYIKNLSSSFVSEPNSFWLLINSRRQQPRIPEQE